MPQPAGSIDLRVCFLIGSWNVQLCFLYLTNLMCCMFMHNMWEEVLCKVTCNSAKNCLQFRLPAMPWPDGDDFIRIHLWHRKCRDDKNGSGGLASQVAGGYSNVLAQDHSHITRAVQHLLPPIYGELLRRSFMLHDNILFQFLFLSSLQERCRRSSSRSCSKEQETQANLRSFCIQ